LNKNLTIGLVLTAVLIAGGAWWVSSNKTDVVPKAVVTEVSPNPTQNDAMITVEMKNMAFVPNHLKVKPGEKITVINRDSVKHNLIATGEGDFDTGLLGKDESAVITAPTEPGEYPFNCTPHPFMTGTLVVE